jgi:uncharacterized membrane protein YdbT with pleckstrin-like domain
MRSTRIAGPWFSGAGRLDGGQDGLPTKLPPPLVICRQIATTWHMAETTIWKGHSSQWKNFGPYVLYAILGGAVIAITAVIAQVATAEVRKIIPFTLLLLIVPIFMAVARYLQTKSKSFELTNERLKITEGVFNKTTDTLELYRVKDLETRQPFLSRLVHVENVQLNTSDSSSPSVFIEAVPSAVMLADKIRNAVEAIRSQKGVREIDVE